MNDEELINKFYQSDEEALEMLFKRHKEGLFNFALRLTSNRADAEDALSHSFMMVCERKYQPIAGASFKTWLYTVARNSCLLKFRHRNKFLSLWSTNDDQELKPIDISDTKESAREHLNHKEVSAMIQKAVNRLPKEQKEALLLREYHSFSYEEIAKVLDCSLEKVKVLIFRARQQLKELLPAVVLEEGR